MAETPLTLRNKTIQFVYLLMIMFNAIANYTTIDECIINNNLLRVIKRSAYISF